MKAPATPAISVITFDLGNVLVKVDHLRFCRRLGDLAGIAPREVYARVFESSLEPGYDTGRITSQEFYQRVTTHFRVTLPYWRFSDFWCDIFDPMDGMEELVRHLVPHYPLYLLSNTNTLHFEYIRKRFNNLLGQFHAFVLSYEVGSRKPEAPIYQALLRQVGRPPEEILFLDDKPTFVAGARHHGLVAWQFRSPGALRRELVRHRLW
jgi:FMN phosphatase YigB (HAD superfamily)